MRYNGFKMLFCFMHKTYCNVYVQLLDKHVINCTQDLWHGLKPLCSLATAHCFNAPPVRTHDASHTHIIVAKCLAICLDYLSWTVHALLFSKTLYGRTIYNMAFIIKQRSGTRHYTELKGIGAQGWEWYFVEISYHRHGDREPVITRLARPFLWETQ